MEPTEAKPMERPHLEAKLKAIKVYGDKRLKIAQEWSVFLERDVHNT